MKHQITYCDYYNKYGKKDYIITDLMTDKERDDFYELYYPFWEKDVDSLKNKMENVIMKVDKIGGSNEIKKKSNDLYWKYINILIAENNKSEFGDGGAYPTKKELNKIINKVMEIL